MSAFVGFYIPKENAFDCRFQETHPGGLVAEGNIGAGNLKSPEPCCRMYLAFFDGKL